jgi:hypothetical protein
MKIKFYITIIYILARMLNTKYGIIDWATELFIWEQVLHLLNANDDFTKMNSEEYEEFMRNAYERMNQEKCEGLKDRQWNLPAPPTSELPNRGPFTLTTPEPPKWWMPDMWTFTKATVFGYTMYAVWLIYKTWITRY